MNDQRDGLTGFVEKDDRDDAPIPDPIDDATGCAGNTLLFGVLVIFALSLLLAPPAKGAEPLSTVGELTAALNKSPAATPVTLSGGQAVGVDVRGGVVTLVEASEPGPPTPLPTAGGPSGHGLMQGGNRNNALTDDQFKHVKIDFVVLRDRWNYQEPQNDVFNFQYNAAQIRRCRKFGTPYVIGVMTGSSTPAHVAGPRYQGVIAPWSPAIAVEYRKLMLALADSEVDGVKIKDDPLLLAVWCTGPTVASQEMHLNGMDRAPGYSPAGIVANFTACIRATKEAVPNKPGILSISGQAPVQAYQPQIIAAMKAEYGKAANFQHNSLGVQTTVTAPHHKILLDLKKQGYRVGAEMVQPGNTAGLSKFPEASYFVLYSGDEKYVK